VLNLTKLHPNPPTFDDKEYENQLMEYISKEYEFNLKFMKAVCLVESSGVGFIDGRPKVRFEPNKFNAKIKANQEPMPYTNNGKGFSSLKSETNYAAYLKAKDINPIAAALSASWGKFQIMGFNFKNSGCESVEKFVEKMYNITGQYETFLTFIKSNRILREVMMKPTITLSDCITFARSYNGPSNKEVYGKKLYKNL